MTTALLSILTAILLIGTGVCFTLSFLLTCRWAELRDRTGMGWLLFTSWTFTAALAAATALVFRMI